MSNFYCLVSNGVIESGPTTLPDSYNNISNISALAASNPELLSDLSWSGNHGKGFWLTTFDEKPSFNDQTEKLELNISLDSNAKTCFVSYSKVNLTNKESATKIQQTKDAAFLAAINNGYTIPNTSIVLSIQESDRNTWGQFLNLLNEMLSSGQITLDSSITILDKDKKAHQFTAAQVKSIIAGIGYYYYTLWISKNT